MPHLNFMDWFETSFDNFSREKKISNSPAFGICYRARNSKYIQIEDSSSISIKKGIPIILELTSQGSSSHDLNFISNLNNQLRKTFEVEIMNKYHFKAGLITIPFDLSNKSEELKNNLPNLIYVFAGMTKEFYDQNQNKANAKKLMDNMGGHIGLWSLKNEKNPLEMVFNYYLGGAQNEPLRKLKGKELNQFLRDYSLESF